MKSRRHRWEEEHRHAQMALGDHCSPSLGPDRRTWEWDECKNLRVMKSSQSWSESRRGWGVREWQSHSRRKGTSWTLRGGSPHDSSGPGIESYLHPLSHCGIKQWRNLRPSRWPSKRPWSLAGPPPCLDRTRCRRRGNGKGVVPLQKAAPTQAHLSHY